MSGNNIREIGDNSFRVEVLEANEPVLVDFWAPWCGPCKMIAPVIEELAADYQGKAKVCKMNVDENTKIPSEYGVMSIPTMVIYKDGKEVNRLVGFMPKASLAKALDQVL